MIEDDDLTKVYLARCRLAMVNMTSFYASRVVFIENIDYKDRMSSGTSSVLIKNIMLYLGTDVDDEFIQAFPVLVV